MVFVTQEFMAKVDEAGKELDLDESRWIQNSKVGSYWQNMLVSPRKAMVLHISYIPYDAIVPLE